MIGILMKWPNSVKRVTPLRDSICIHRGWTDDCATVKGISTGWRVKNRKKRRVWDLLKNIKTSPDSQELCSNKILESKKPSKRATSWSICFPALKLLTISCICDFPTENTMLPSSGYRSSLEGPSPSEASGVWASFFFGFVRKHCRV